MTGELQKWREHRVDYRAPAVLALLLLLGIGLLLPADWLQLAWLGPSSSEAPRVQRLQLAEDEGLQILDVEVLAPVSRVASIPSPVAQRVEEGEASPVEEDNEGGEGEFDWDPTHAYRVGEELLMPPAPGEVNETPEMLRRLEFLLSTEGVASYTLADTSHAALAHTHFTRLQREIFLQSAPGWAYEKAVERYRENLNRMLFDNPLRGPQ